MPGCCGPMYNGYDDVMLTSFFVLGIGSGKIFGQLLAAYIGVIRGVKSV